MFQKPTDSHDYQTRFASVVSFFQTRTNFDRHFIETHLALRVEGAIHQGAADKSAGLEVIIASDINMVNSRREP